MTEATIRALEGLRDLSTLKWYVIPMLSVVFYIYTIEMKKARKSGDWNVVLAGLTLFGADFFNETWNGWIMQITGRSAFWTAPGPTAFRSMVGWNIEIMFMFAILGIIYANTVHEDRDVKILGIPNRWFWAIGYTVFCVFIEVLLNIGGMLVWEYSFWTRSFAGVWLIALLGYFWFFVITKVMMELKTYKQKITLICILYGVSIILNLVARFGFGWIY